MAIVPITLPPGVYRNGTETQGRGRYSDCNLVRWSEGALRPMGGWNVHADFGMEGAARAIITWVDNNAVRRSAIGTHSKLYVVSRKGDKLDITPNTLVVGHAGARKGGGYGMGDFGGAGDGAYGVKPLDETLVGDATVWSLDTFGEDLVACNADDGVIYRWAQSDIRALPATGAPAHNRALVVTEEGFLFALGAQDNPRLVKWADQWTTDQWAEDPTRQAGSFPLQTTGRLMCGKRIRGGTLLFTDQDAYLATYQGPPLIYGFDRIGTGCGVISQGAAVVGGDALAAWMGQAGFWIYDGTARPLPCEVSDHVFSDFNSLEASRVTAVYSPTFGEFTWFYPSAGSDENDRYVRWNHRENHWAIGRLARTCAAPEGVFPDPLMVAPNGKVYAHETGFSYDGAQPYAETGPIDFGNGDRVFTARALIPDENTLGDVSATFYGRFTPTRYLQGDEDTDLIYGPYSPNLRTDIRFSARQVRMRLTGTQNKDWRIGGFKVDVTMGGLR